MNLLKLKKKWIGEQVAVLSFFVVLNNLAFLKILIKFVHGVFFYFLLNKNICDNYKFISNIKFVLEAHPNQSFSLINVRVIFY